MLQDELWEKLKQLPKDDLDQGITLMQQYLRESAKDITIMSELAYWFYRKGDNKSLEQALLLCDTALQIQETWEIFYIKGLITYKLGDSSYAVSYFEKSRDIKLDFPENHYVLGKIFFEKGDYIKAEEYFRKTLDLLPGFRSARSYLEEISRRLDH